MISVFNYKYKVDKTNIPNNLFELLSKKHTTFYKERFESNDFTDDAEDSTQQSDSAAEDDE